MSSAVSRRSLILGGAAAATGAVGAMTLPGAARADGTADTTAAAVNPASIPTGTALIDVSVGSTAWPGLSAVQNHGTSTTLQSFAFDSAAQQMYTLQLAGASTVSYSESGSQVASTGTIGGDAHATAGDLVLSRIDMNSGDVVAVMYLLGFGHGVSLGVEPASGSTPPYIWTEGGAAESGYGHEIVRFPFVDKTVLWTSHPSVQRLPSPDPNAGAMTPSVDVAHGLLVIRYQLAGSTWPWFAAYDLAGARAAAGGTASTLPAALARIQQPPLWVADADGADTTTAATFQGFTSFGQYVYMLDGTARPTGDTGPGLSGAEVWAIRTTSMDLNGTLNDPTTGYIRRTHSVADADAVPREPEGMSVYTGASSPRLGFAITDNSGSVRQFDLYYKA